MFGLKREREIEKRFLSRFLEKMTNLKFLPFALLFVLVELKLGLAAPWSKCLIKPTNVKIESMDLDNCNSKKRCTFRQGEKGKIVIKFVADQDYKNLERAVYGIMNNGTDNAPDAVEVPFGKKKDACQFLTGDFKDGSCKDGGLLKGNTYTYTDIIEVLPEYPKILLTARYIIRESNARGSTKPLDRKQVS